MLIGEYIYYLFISYYCVAVLILCFVYEPLCFQYLNPFRAFVLFNCSACFRCIITEQQTLLMIIFSTNYSIYVYGDGAANQSFPSLLGL